jgi:uncharacterized membrane protein YkoI
MLTSGGPPPVSPLGGFPMRIWRTVLTVAVTLAIGSTARAQEEKVPLDKVPAKVMAAVKDKFKDAEVLSASKEVEEGKTLFEVQLKLNGQAHDVTLTEDGTIIEVEKEIAAKDLPRAVAEALQAKYPKATYKKVEEIAKEGKTLYEVLLDTADKKSWEVVLDPTGKLVETEDKTGKKDEDEAKKKDK